MNKKSMLNIVMVCYPGHGGSGVVATELGIALARQGHQVHFVSYEIPFRLVDKLALNNNLHFHSMDCESYPLFRDFPYSFVLANKLVEVCLNNNIDLIHLHYAIPHVESGYIAKQQLAKLGKRIAVINTVHGTDVNLLGINSSYHRILNFLLDESDGITYVSKFLEQSVQESFNLSLPNQVIHNFVDTDQFNPHCVEIQDFLVPRHRKIILYASNFRPVKNATAVIQIFERVYQIMGDSVCLVLVGEGPEVAKVRQMLYERPHLSDSVFFLGCIRHIEMILPSADVFVSTSHSESFGLIILEAMSCGVPILASRVGGVPEVVVDGETGFLFDKDDETGMTNQIIAILNDSDLHYHISQQARKSVLDKFHVEKAVQQYKDFYDSILDSLS